MHLGPDFMFDLSEIRLRNFDLSGNKLYRNVLQKSGPLKSFDLSENSTYPSSTYPRLTVVHELSSIFKMANTNEGH